MWVAVPGTALHLGSSSQGSRGSSYPPGHLGERHQLRLFLAPGMEGGYFIHAPQGYSQNAPLQLHPPPFSFPFPAPLFIPHPSLQHLLSRSITHCTTDIQHYSRVKAIFFLRWIPTHLLTWRELWRHSFVMSLEAFVCFSVIGDEAHRQAVCKWHQRLGLGEATVFTYKTTKNMV